MANPPKDMAPNERILFEEEITSIPFTQVARNLVHNKGAPDRESEFEKEIVTQSEEFGTIYRYSLLSHSSDGAGKRNVFAIQVIWTKDGITGRIATYSTIKLPEELENLLDQFE